jgi:undecaprenyl-diphosphatase
VVLALVGGIAAAVVALGFLVWLGGTVLEGGATHFDLRLRSAVHGLASPPLTGVMRAASYYGAPRHLAPLMLLLGFGFVLRGWPRGGLLVVVTLVGATVLNVALKGWFGRVRPEPFFEYPLPDSPSFPSGHALFAVCVFGGLAAVASFRLRHRGARIAVWIIAVAVIALIGISRVYLGVHYPTDVLAGYTVGLIWVTAVTVGDRPSRKWPTRGRALGEPSRRVDR